MLLSPEEFSKHCQIISSLKEGAVGYDYETNGLYARKGDRAFILGFSYRDASNIVNHCVRLLDDSRIPELIRLFLSNSRIKYLSHNSKFERSFDRHQFKAECEGDIWDTEVMARVLKNNHGNYSLQDCAKRIGLSKHRPMLDWLHETKKLHHEAPPELIVPYVEQDAYLEIPLYEHQRDHFIDWELHSTIPIWPVVELEMKTTKNLFEIEDAGVRLDVDYCHEAFHHETRVATQALLDFKSLTGVEFVSSAKCLAPIFDQLGLQVSKTPLGTPAFNEDSLSPHKDHPVVKLIFTHRRAVKRANTYFKNFVDMHHNGVIHCNLNQNRAANGRMSSSEPNTQNWPKWREGDASQYPVRRAFIADPGCEILSMDWQAMELRQIAYEAQDQKMLAAFKTGHDFHQEVADAAQVTRDCAKTARFAGLYGAGGQRMADTLECSLEVAQRVRRSLKEQSPEIEAYTRRLIRSAELSGVGYGYLGRRYFFTREFAYTYPNYRISGGCGEVLRIATDKIIKFLKSEAKGNTNLILLIHDECVFNMDPVDRKLIPDIKRLMIESYHEKPDLHDVSIAYGPNFQDLIEVA